MRLKSYLVNFLVKLLAERISFLWGGHTREMCRAPGSHFTSKRREPP